MSARVFFIILFHFGNLITLVDYLTAKLCWFFVVIIVVVVTVVEER